LFDENTSILGQAEMIKLCRPALEESCPRNDYEELSNRRLIFLGGADGENVSFRTPGAFHHARWMTKAIYCINIFFFHQHFSLTVNEKRSLKELALFVSLDYVWFWYQAPLPIRAPLNGIILIEELTKYPNIAVALAATTAIWWDHWYFSEILVGLSFLMKEFGLM